VTEWIAGLFEHYGLTRMGHLQRVEDRNLGLGWLYYALARILRPAHVVVIGSHRGFVPLVLARALHDNLERGEVTFIDPSLVDDFWTDPARVNEYFAGFGTTNIRHHKLTTQQFVDSAVYRDLPRVGLLFVDGYHSAEQARFDHEAFRNRMTADGLVLFHDSTNRKSTRMYGPEGRYEYSVTDYMNELKADAAWQVFDLPFGAGVTLVRRATEKA
jgi:predicted O-methyltransferase YrrM